MSGLYWTVVVWGLIGTAITMALPASCAITGDRQPTRVELMLCASLWPFLLVSMAVRSLLTGGKSK